MTVYLLCFPGFVFIFFKASYQFQVSRAQKGETGSPYLMHESQQQLMEQRAPVLGGEFWALGVTDSSSYERKRPACLACIAEISVFCLRNKTLGGGKRCILFSSRTQSPFSLTWRLAGCLSLDPAAAWSLSSFLPFKSELWRIGSCGWWMGKSDGRSCSIFVRGVHVRKSDGGVTLSRGSSVP